LNVHDAPAAMAAHVDPLIENSPALLLLIEVTTMGAPPVLLTVTTTGDAAEPSIALGMLGLVSARLPCADGGGTAPSVMPYMGTVNEPPLPKLHTSDALSNPTPLGA
jgi:hypothetical protein